MMGTGHDLVVELRIQKTLQTGGEVGTALRGKRGIDKVAPIAIDDRQVAEHFARGEHESGAKFVAAHFQAEILCAAAADGAGRLVREREEAAAILVFMQTTAKKLAEGLRALRFTQVNDDFGFGDC